MQAVAREVFALLLQLVERQERQQMLRQQQRQQRPQQLPQQQQQRQAQPRAFYANDDRMGAVQSDDSAPNGLPASALESLAPLAWALSRYSCCQPVLLDAVALLLEPHLADLLPTQVLLLLEACTAVLGPIRSQAGGSDAAGGVAAGGRAGGAGAGGAGASGAEQLLLGLVPVITGDVQRYSPDQAAQVAVQYAAARLYDEGLIRQVRHT